METVTYLEPLTFEPLGKAALNVCDQFKVSDGNLKHDYETTDVLQDLMLIALLICFVLAIRQARE